jgi:hypothetical protein
MLALSTRQRILATLVLTGGALASVATSQVYWDLQSEIQTVPPAVLDLSTPEVGYRIDIDYTGPTTEPEGSLDIQLTPAVTVVANAPPATFEIQLIDAQTSELVHTQTLTLDSAQTVDVYAYATAWMSCESACSETFELWIERTDLVADAPRHDVSFTGTAYVDLREGGNGSEPPPGTTVNLSIERIEFTTGSAAGEPRRPQAGRRPAAELSGP